MSDEAPSAEQQTTLFPTPDARRIKGRAQGRAGQGRAGQGKARQGKARPGSRADGLDWTERDRETRSQHQPVPAPVPAVRSCKGRSVRAGVCRSDRRYLESEDE